MTNPLKVYDPDRITAIFAGIPLKGFADGTFIQITPTTARFASVVGTDGEVTRSKTNDRRFTITFSLMQSSDSNLLLSSALKLDDDAPNGAGVGVLSIVDLSGTSLFITKEAWITGYPEQGFDRQAGPREWVLECATANILVGGN